MFVFIRLMYVSLVLYLLLCAIFLFVIKDASWMNYALFSGVFGIFVAIFKFIISKISLGKNTNVQKESD
jgi:hypothetical protein